MGKDSILGNDPLSWMKMASERKKLYALKNENTADLNTKEIEQQTNSQTTNKQEVFVPAHGEEVRDAAGIQQSLSKAGTLSENTVLPKPKVVIGRLYEKPSVVQVKSVQQDGCTGISQEARHHMKSPLYEARTIQPIKKTASEIHHISVSNISNRFSTYIIIAYTALMLILGYLVYSDLSKRTSRIEARLLLIEKALSERK